MQRFRAQPPLRAPAYNLALLRSLGVPSELIGKWTEERGQMSPRSRPIELLGECPTPNLHPHLQPLLHSHPHPHCVTLALNAAGKWADDRQMSPQSRAVRGVEIMQLEPREVAPLQGAGIAGSRADPDAPLHVYRPASACMRGIV